MRNSLKRASKFMSLILRHKPQAIGAELDDNGWLDVEVLLAGMRKRGHRIDKMILREIVVTNEKKRFAFNIDKTKIRASQGHSLEVDVEMPETEPPEFLYHGTVDKFMDAIKEKGLLPMTRQHVHLSQDKETAINVGGRRGKPIILSVRTGDMFKDGKIFYLSANNVWLTEDVPSEYIEFKDLKEN